MRPEKKLSIHLLSSDGKPMLGSFIVRQGRREWSGSLKESHTLSLSLGGKGITSYVSMNAKG